MTKRHTPLPAHIAADKLPHGAWLANGGAGPWMLKRKNMDTGRWQSKRLCGVDSSLTEIWMAFEALNAPLAMTFAALSADFQTTPLWRRLAVSTQRDYLDCHQSICGRALKNGDRLGSIPISKWTIGTVRKYRDIRGEESASRANKELAYIKRIFSWAYEYEKLKFNPADGVKKLTIKARQHYAEDKDYEFMLSIAKASNYWYVPICMEIAYLCRMRLSEVLDLTDANEQSSGLLIKRRKGSRDNVTRWNNRLTAAWQTAISTRNKILSERKQPHPIRPEDRFVFISERTGNPIQVSSLKTALARIGTAAEQAAKEQGIEFVRFTFHDLKRKGVSDTEGDKQRASGHRTASMLNIYDVKIAEVDAASE
jgi:integrase